MDLNRISSLSNLTLKTIFCLCLLSSSFSYGADTIKKISVSKSNAQATLEKEKIKAESSNSAKLLLDFKKHALQKKTDLNSLRLDVIKVKQKMGPGSGSGGDSCALMILANAKALLVKIYDEKAFGKNTEIAQKFEQALLNSKVYYSKELSVDGRTVDAINYPNEGILSVSERFCERLKDVSIASMGTLFHEAAGLAEIEDRHYEISGDFVANLKATDYNPRTIEGSEKLNLMKGNDIELQQDILMVANEFTKLFRKDRLTGLIKVLGNEDYDRILPKALRTRIVNVESWAAKSLAGTCLVNISLSLSHPEFTTISLKKPSTRTELCDNEYGNEITVADFYELYGEYFLLKAKPPIILN